MKKLLYFATVCGVIAALGASCHTKTKAATPGEAAQRCVTDVMNNDYEAFVDQISFLEPVAVENKKAAAKTHAAALRAIHHPDVTEHGGSKAVEVVREEMAPDNKTCDVTVVNHYNDDIVKTIDLQMVNEDDVWKVRETPYKELWRATTSDGETEVIKVRSGHERDFIKDKDLDTGEKQFIKDISKRDGRVEVIKVLEDGRRHREVIKGLKEGANEIDKLKMDGDKFDVKDLNRHTKEILKEKEVVDGRSTRNKEVINK
jgi:hypothetical protein